MRATPARPLVTSMEFACGKCGEAFLVPFPEVGAGRLDWALALGAGAGTQQHLTAGSWQQGHQRCGGARLLLLDSTHLRPTVDAPSSQGKYSPPVACETTGCRGRFFVPNRRNATCMDWQRLSVQVGGCGAWRCRRAPPWLDERQAAGQQSVRLTLARLQGLPRDERLGQGRVPVPVDVELLEDLVGAACSLLSAGAGCCGGSLCVRMKQQHRPAAACFIGLRALPACACQLHPAPRCPPAWPGGLRRPWGRGQCGGRGQGHQRRGGRARWATLGSAAFDGRSREVAGCRLQLEMCGCRILSRAHW